MKANMRAYTILKSQAKYVVKGKELQYKTLLRELKENKLERRINWSNHG